jgi:hypothetical protein
VVPVAEVGSAQRFPRPQAVFCISLLDARALNQFTGLACADHAIIASCSRCERSPRCGALGLGTVDRILRNLRFDLSQRKVLLVFDEAQHLSIECLETIRESFGPTN